MAALAEKPAEGQMEARVAWAVALAETGQYEAATSQLGQLIAELELESRTSFAAQQVLHLARSVSIKLRAAAGESGRALDEARRLRPLLRDGLLPAILVDEVLAGR